MAESGIVEFKIYEHIVVLERYGSGWSLEANIVGWNGGDPKIDIRSWSPDHERMTRGITLTEEQGEKLAKHLSQRTKSRHMTAGRDTMER